MPCGDGDEYLLPLEGHSAASRRRSRNFPRTEVDMATNETIGCFSISSDALRLARIQTARNLAAPAAVGFALTLAAMVTTLIVASPPGALFQPMVWQFVGPIWGIMLLTAVVLWYAAKSLNSFRSGWLFKVAFGLVALNWLLGDLLIFLHSFLAGPVWFLAFVTSTILSIWPLALLILGLRSIPSEKNNPLLYMSGSTGENAFSASSQAMEHLRRPEDSSALQWMLFSTALFAGALFTWFNLSGWLQGRANWLRVGECPAGQQFSSCLEAHDGEAIIIVLSSILLSVVLARAARKARQKSFERVRRTATEQMRFDMRAPIIFLRSFPVDRTKYEEETPGPINTLCDLGRAPRNLDHLLLEEATAYGPVIAVGDPNVDTPSIGAARESLGDSSWQKTVSEWIAVSRGVVLCFGDTPGVSWEFDEVSKQQAFSRTLTLLTKSTNDAMVRKKLELPPFDIPPGEQLLGVIGFGLEATPLTSSKLSYEAYKLAIHAAFGS
jgi:hypothetical protein